jgi:hypothetical protein
MKAPAIKTSDTIQWTIELESKFKQDKVFSSVYTALHLDCQHETHPSIQKRSNYIPKMKNILENILN